MSQATVIGRDRDTPPKQKQCPHCRVFFPESIPGQITCKNKLCDRIQELTVQLRNERAANARLRAYFRVAIEGCELLDSGRLDLEGMRQEARKLASTLRPQAKKTGQ
jgi:hypothetical protein